MPGAYQGKPGKKSIPTIPGSGGQFNAAAKDLTGNDSVQQQTTQELAEIKRRKRMLGSTPAISPAVQALTGNAY